MAEPADPSPLECHLRRLLDSRGDGKTICPSEAARALSTTELGSEGASSWRDLMPRARELLFDMRAAGTVQILQRGEVLGDEVRLGDVRGPIRARRTVGREETQKQK